jgi:hypothetical protein
VDDKERLRATSLDPSSSVAPATQKNKSDAVVAATEAVALVDFLMDNMGLLGTAQRHEVLLKLRSSVTRAGVVIMQGGGSLPILSSPLSLRPPETLDAVLGTDEGWRSWDFDVLSLTDAQLVPVTLCIFENWGHLASLSLDVGLFGAFIAALYQDYARNPYHNYRHALSMLQAAFMLPSENKGLGHLSTLEQCALLLSCIVRHLGHPGLNDTFQIRAQCLPNMRVPGYSCCSDTQSTTSWCMLIAPSQSN